MKITAILHAAFVILFAAPMNAQPSKAQDISAADQSLDAFFRAYLDADFELSPMRATRLGDHRFDQRLDDVSPAAREKRLELARRTLETLPQKVAFTELSRGAQVDFEILRENLTLDLWLEETERAFENDPRLYTGLATECAYVLLTQSTLPAEMNLTNAIARIRLVPAMLIAARENLKHPPRIVTETAIRQNKGAIAFYQSEILAMIGDSPQRGTLKEVSGEAANALEIHQDFLEKVLLPRSSGEWRIGRERFARKLEKVLDAGITAEQVIAEAEAQFVETRRDMLLISRQLWAKYFPKVPLPANDAEGQRETILRVIEEVGFDHGKPEELAANARATVATLKQFITDHGILQLPEPDRCQIIEMPEFQRGNSIAFLNPAPPLDSASSSIYAISPPPGDWETSQVESFLSEYNAQMLKVLTIHEAYPGHYVQLEYANRHPSLIRRVLGSGVYMEGWANYCEQMILDQGYGEGDLALRLMQLKFFLRSIANAILDHKMHSTAMTDEEALRFLTDEAFQNEGEAKLKVTRSQLGSCQLSTYFVGRSAFMRLRRELQREMGDAFALGRFHEAILGQGSVPVKYLPELTRAGLDPAQEPR